MSIQAFISYLEYEKKYSPHTVLAYKKDLENFSAFAFNQFEYKTIENVHYPIIRGWIIQLVDSGITNRTVNRKISSLKSYYKFLLKTGVIKENPLVKHKALKVAKKVQVPFSENEIQEVLTLLENPQDFESSRDKLIIELFYTTGIRRAELINIKVSDINISQKTVKVLGKRNKERILPLLPILIETYNQYIEYRNNLPNIVDAEFLFLSKNGVKIYETFVYRIIKSYFSRVSQKTKRSPHILRHSFATHLLNQGADLKAVKELLGHASLASTQVYTHTNIAKLKDVYSKSHPRK
jgi:integrase/recombinase XerC